MPVPQLDKNVFCGTGKMPVPQLDKNDFCNLV